MYVLLDLLLRKCLTVALYFKKKSPKIILMINILAQTCIEQIPDTRSACHQAENSEKFGWKVNAKVIFSKIPTEHLGLRFGVVTFIPVGKDKTKCCCTIYPSLRSNLTLYIFAPFLQDSKRNAGK